MRMRAGFQRGPLNSTPDGPRGAKNSARLYLLNNNSHIKKAKFEFGWICTLTWNLLAAHAAKIFKAVTSDSDAAEDTKDPVGDVEEDKDDLDQVQDYFLSSKIMTEDSMANDEIAVDCYSNMDQLVPCRVT